MRYFPQALSEKGIANILYKLHRIEGMMTELHTRKNVSGYYLKKGDFLFGGRAKCEKYYYRDVPKIEARLAGMFQTELNKLVDVNTFVDEFPNECSERLVEEHFETVEKAVIEIENT